MKNIDNFVYNYVKKYNLNEETTIDKIPDIFHFFNKMSETIFGKPTDIIDCLKPQSTSSLQYSVLGKPFTALDVTIFTIENLFPYIIANSKEFEFNYKNFNDKLLKLIYYRFETDYIVRIFIELYISLIFGMINNPKSNLRSNNINIRKDIINKASDFIFNIARNIVNNSIKLYYIDTNCFIIEATNIVFIKNLINSSFDIHDKDIDIEYIETIAIFDIKKYCMFNTSPYRCKNSFIKDSIVKKDNQRFINSR